MNTELGCTVDHLACTAQPRGYTEMVQVLTFAHVEGWKQECHACLLEGVRGVHL